MIYLNNSNNQEHKSNGILSLSCLFFEFFKSQNSQGMISSLNKLTKRQPLQQLAFHKQPHQINGVQFQCFESYYEGELLNGIDLHVKQLKGLKPQDKLYGYLPESQEIVFWTSSSLMIYNTHRKNYHQLLTLNAEIEILSTHLEKMNNREYIVWMEKHHQLSESKNTQAKGKKKNNSRHIRNSRSSSKRVSKNILKSIFSVSGLQSQKPNINNTTTSNPSSFKPNTTAKKTQQKDIHFHYIYKIYDYTRKQLVFESPINVPPSHYIKDIFMFWNHYKIAGYITQQYQSNLRYVHYKTIEKNKNEKRQSSHFGFQLEDSFNIIETDKQISNLMFNNEMNNYIFYQGNQIHVIKPKEEEEDLQNQLFNQFLNLTDDHYRNSKESNHKRNSVKVQLQICFMLDLKQPIKNVTINDQYLAILIGSKVCFHSAYDMSSNIFQHIFQEQPLIPSKVYFSKASLMVTFQNSLIVQTYSVKNKSLKYYAHTKLELNHCKEILQVYTNHISSQLFCVVLFYELESRQNRDLKNMSLLQNLVQFTMKPDSIDIAAAFLTPSSNSETKLLGISQKQFKRIHVCPWLSSYIVQTHQDIEFKGWKQTIENKKCIAIHPTGLFLIICLKESFKIYIVTFEGFINTYRGDSIKDIQSCSISYEGNHFAVSSTNLISIYDFYSCKKIKTIVLPLGVTIETLEYSKHYLICYLKNKKIYLYDCLNLYKQIFIFNPRIYINENITSKQDQIINSGPIVSTIQEIFTMVTFSFIYYDYLLNFFIYSYKSTIYFFNCTTQTVQIFFQFQPLSYIYYNPNLKTLFFGTINGEIICFPWPNKPLNLQNQHRRFKLHAGAIIDIKVSSDLKQIITVADDDSMCISSFIYVENLKKYEGLQLVQHLSSAKICYDFLLRKGFQQYTHTKYNSKLDSLKDYEEEVLNMNFILPQQRQKQKQQMLCTIKQDMRCIAETSNREYYRINQSTNEAKDMVSLLRDQYTQFCEKREEERQQFKDQLFSKYMEYYNKTEASNKQLAFAHSNNQKSIQMLKEQFIRQKKAYQEQCQRKYKNILSQFQTQKRIWKKNDFAEIAEVEQEKKDFLSQNVTSLNGMISDLNNNNGILACKNNNLQKQNADLKRKIEEHKYLLYRLQTSMNKLNEQHYNYENLKKENKKNIQKEDKINLTQIEKRYVKQTQKLIEKDKEINVRLVNHEKEKGILIHLQKCVEDIEGNIESLIDNILKQKKSKKEQMQRLQKSKIIFQSLSTQFKEIKKDKISSRNVIKNFVCQLENMIQDVHHIRSQSQIKQKLEEKGIIQKAVQQKKGKNYHQRECLQKLISQRVYNINSQPIKLSKQKYANNLRNMKDYGSYRILKTQGSQFASITSKNAQKAILAVTSREIIDKKAKEVYKKLDSQQKQYERIKTEQTVFDNTRKKFNLQNQDLLENYNSLVIQNKRIIHSIKKQDRIQRLPQKKEKNGSKGDNSSTPFQLYLMNKTLTEKSQRVGISSKIYEL